jgi:Mrp family chromosome partitioning ATPase
MINGAGLTTLLTSNDASVERVIRSHESIPGLFYITAGPEVPDPAALLMSDRFGDIAHELKRRFDVVVFDSPPVLGFPDSRILGRYSDGVVLVVEEGRLSQADIRTAVSAIASAPGGPILGLVVNKARPNGTHLMYSGYYYDRNGRK